MHFTSFLVAAMATLATAADQTTSSTTTTRPFMGAGLDWASKISNVPKPKSTAASVVGINSHLTTYEIACMSGVPKSVCEISKPWTLIQGSTTFSFTGEYTAATTGKVGTVTVDREFKCSFTSTSLSASCSFEQQVTGSHSGTEYSTATSSSTTSLPTDSITYYKMPVTGGLEKLTATQTTHSTAAANPTARALVTAGPLGAVAAMAIGAMF